MTPTILRAFSTAATAAALIAAAAPARATDLALTLEDPAEAFGEYSYYDAYAKADPDDLIDQGLWTTCWAFIKAEQERLHRLAEEGPEEHRDELNWAAVNYQVAQINYNELIRGTAIYRGDSNASVNAEYTMQEQALLGGDQQWLSSNAADCVFKMPVREMPKFGELYPWLADALGATSH